jgi:hypothetical protein
MVNARRRFLTVQVIVLGRELDPWQRGGKEVSWSGGKHSASLFLSVIKTV